MPGRNKHSERHLRTCRNQHFAASLLTPKTASSSLQLPAPPPVQLHNATEVRGFHLRFKGVKCGKYSVFWRPLKLFFLGGSGGRGGVLFFCGLQPPISGFFFQRRVRRYIIETNEVGVSCQRHCSTEAITQLHRRVPKWGHTERQNTKGSPPHYATELLGSIRLHQTPTPSLSHGRNSINRK